MKRLWMILLLSLLLVTGCANANGDPTDTTLPAETEPVGSYIADSSVENETGGAVRKYKLDYTGYKWIMSMGDSLLMASDSQLSDLQAISGDVGVVSGTAELPLSCLDSCAAMFNGFAYYDAENSAVVYLDTQLNQTNSISLPEHTIEPVIAPDGGEIFYYTGSQIRALDTQRNISRLIKETSIKVQQLQGTCLDGEVLICTVGDSAEGADTLYISTQNGQTLCTENGIEKLYTYEDTYFTIRRDGVISQRIYGALNGEAKLLNIPEGDVIGVLELNGVVGYKFTENGVSLSFYDLASGTKTSAVTVPNITQIKNVVPDRWSGCVWVLATSGSCSGDELLRWDPKASAVQEDAVYFETLFTQQQPDEEGLKACQSRVNDLNKTYGVRIQIWQDAVKTPGQYPLVPEHQTGAINMVLDALEPVLAEFPKNFLLKSISSRIRICVVRSVNGDSQPVQYWNGDDAFVILPVGTDIRTGFLKGFGFVIDSHVLGNSAKYDYWNDLNPEGFVYGQPDENFLGSFADMDAMISAVADRCSVFCNAMLPENGELFQSETMQKKLLLVCEAIRDAWNLKWKTDVYPWEQYLAQSIAYQK